VLYRREVERLGDEQAAVASVRNKFYDEIWIIRAGFIDLYRPAVKVRVC
jgi:hypothetical protein